MIKDVIRRRRRLRKVAFAEMAGGPAEISIMSSGDKILMFIESKKPELKRAHSITVTIEHKEVVELLGAFYNAGRDSERSDEWRKRQPMPTDYDWWELIPADGSYE